MGRFEIFSLLVSDRPAGANAASLPVAVIDEFLLTEQENRESATVMVKYLGCVQKVELH